MNGWDLLILVVGFAVLFLLGTRISNLLQERRIAKMNREREHLRSLYSAAATDYSRRVS